MALSREEVKKLMGLPIEELAASVADGDPGSPKTTVVECLLNYRLQKGLLDSSRCSMWATIAIAVASIIIGIIAQLYSIQ